MKTSCVLTCVCLCACECVCTYSSAGHWLSALGGGGWDGKEVEGLPSGRGGPSVSPSTWVSTWTPALCCLERSLRAWLYDGGRTREPRGGEEGEGCVQGTGEARGGEEGEGCIQVCRGGGLGVCGGWTVGGGWWSKSSVLLKVLRPAERRTWLIMCTASVDSSSKGIRLHGL